MKVAGDDVGHARLQVGSISSNISTYFTTTVVAKTKRSGVGSGSGPGSRSVLLGTLHSVYKNDSNNCTHEYTFQHAACDDVKAHSV